jgi:DNA-binding YbaB/EbfC family protein
MNPNMLKKLQKMQKDIMIAQKELEASTFYGFAGGIVTVEFTGDKKMKRLTIEKGALEQVDDLGLLEDTIVAAVNDCMNKIDAETQSIMSQFSQGGLNGIF